MTTHTEASRTGIKAANASRHGADALLLIKLLERHAFERGQVRLCAALLHKFDVKGPFPGGPTRVELEDLLLQWHAQVRVLGAAMGSVGERPMMSTPAADGQASILESALAIIADPGTSLAQCIEALLTVERAGIADWMALAQLADEMGQQAHSEQFLRAQALHDEQLVRMYAWVAAAQEGV